MTVDRRSWGVTSSCVFFSRPLLHRAAGGVSSVSLAKPNIFFLPFPPLGLTLLACVFIMVVVVVMSQVLGQVSPGTVMDLPALRVFEALLQDIFARALGSPGTPPPVSPLQQPLPPGMTLPADDVVSSSLQQQAPEQLIQQLEQQQQQLEQQLELLAQPLVAGGLQVQSQQKQQQQQSEPLQPAAAAAVAVPPLVVQSPSSPAPTPITMATSPAPAPAVTMATSPAPPPSSAPLIMAHEIAAAVEHLSEEIRKHCKSEGGKALSHCFQGTAAGQRSFPPGCSAADEVVALMSSHGEAAASCPPSSTSPPSSSSGDNSQQQQRQSLERRANLQFPAERVGQLVDSLCGAWGHVRGGCSAGAAVYLAALLE